MLGKNDLAFEVRHLVTEFPLFREAQALRSLGNWGSLSKVRWPGLGAEYTSPSSAYPKDEYSYVPTALYDVKLWTRTALHYCLLTSECSSSSYVSRRYKCFPPHSDQAESQTCRRCTDNGAVFPPFPSFSNSLTCRHCNIGVTVLLAAATCWPQLLLLWPLTSNPDIASYLLKIAVVIFKINVVSPHTASHC